MGLFSLFKRNRKQPSVPEPEPEHSRLAASPGPESTLGDEKFPMVSAQSAPLVEEVAILFADQQLNLAEQMLIDGLEDEEPRTAWWMLFDLYRVTGRQEQFDHLAIDYASKFETAPPPFIAPHRITAAAPDRFMLPLVIEGNTDALISAINAYAEQYQSLVFDCSHLVRIDFSAAGQLLSCLQALAGAGKKIELRDLNHLVAALLRLLAFADIGKIFPHKY